jgi:pilus assembly protein FimV
VNHLKKIAFGVLFLSSLMFAGVAYSGYAHYGPTLENEHLYRIALRIKPDEKVSVQQVMIALLHKNPNAFNKANINGLRSGYRLNIPRYEEIKAMTMQAAANEVEQQNLAWNNKSIDTGHQVAVAAKETTEKTVPVDANKVAFAQEFAPEAGNLRSSPPELAMTRFATVPENTTPISLVGFMQDTKSHEQFANTQISNLEQQTKALELKVAELKQELRTVKFHTIQLSAIIKKAQSENYGIILMDNLRKYGLSLLGCLLLLAILIVLYRKLGKAKSDVPNNNGPEDEYHFLDGQDNLSTKLDLARAYVDMGDNHAAASTLADVLQRGNKDQRQSARDLMSKLNLVQ